MTNPFYTRVFNPLPGQRVDEQTLKDEYQRVEQGFDGVETAVAAAVASIAGKANLAGGNTWTGAQDFTAGSVLVPTPTLASHAASKEYTDALAFGTALPDQAGNSGKVVGTDGSTASWLYAVTRKERVFTGSDTIVATDRQKIVKFTGVAAATLAFDLAATLTDGFVCLVQNATLFDLTLDPAGSEQVDGRTSYIMYPGEVRELRCSGTAFSTVVLAPFFKVVDTSGNFIKPPGYASFDGLMWGGAPSGEWRDGGGANGYGAGGAMCLPFKLLASALSDSTAMVIGAGGTRRTTLGYNAGGNTTFAGLTAYAGGIGTVDQGGQLPNIPLTAFSDLVGSIAFMSRRAGAGTDTANLRINYHYAGAMGSNSASSPSSALPQISMWGGGGGGMAASSPGSTTGGLSLFGGNGGNGGNNAVAATDGAIPGGGGGGYRWDSGSNLGAGAGGRGEIRIWGIA